MTRYLVTDPCYVVPNDDWDKFLNETGFGEICMGEDPYVIEGFGKILVSDGTDGGDGCWNVSRGKQVMADAGLVCIVELDEGVVPTEYNGNAVTRTLGVAEHWFNIVTGHENFQ